jgi:hypothetical protein
MEAEELFDALLCLTGDEKLLIVKVADGVLFGLVIEEAKKHCAKEDNTQEKNEPVSVFHPASYEPTSSKKRQ